LLHIATSGRYWFKILVYDFAESPNQVLFWLYVQDNRVVAFIKGTRTAPQCGFSHKVRGPVRDIWS